MAKFNIVPEELGTITEEQAIEQGEDLDLEDPKDAQKAYDRNRRENYQVWRRRGGTVL